MTPQLYQRNTLNEPFSEVGYKQLIEGLVECEFYDETKQITYDSDVIKSVENIGTFQGNRFHNILIINHTAGIGARVKLATQTFKLMAASNIDAALVAYYSDEDKLWRVSLVTLSLEESSTGRVTKVFSNPRRYSYVLGSTAKTITPYKFLISKGVSSDFNDLVSRFSVEVVNNEFYREIAKLYDELVGSENSSPAMKYPELGEASHQFAVRLIGRIVFCWFLREKHSINGAPLINRSILSRESANKDDYYNGTLAPLFFETLNKPVNNRVERFQIDDFGKVPYLNGGLFAPQKDDYYKYDDELARSVIGEVNIPDSWLRKLLDLLELYHFTVDENTSIDVDLSIDPEMLGRIFENLLARINPETGETVRKATGSFYTPREIVEYMVDESLVDYLSGATTASEDSLRALISYDLLDDLQHPLKDLDKYQIVKAISDLKVLDPACGSGAFPIGVLQKIVFILQRIDPDAQIWFENQIVATAPEVRRLIEREFENKNFDYIRKLGIIRESIFGVDIQPIATEIARLRCFLTLIVDERVIDEEDNRGVYPLPNLDFKFVTANTLIKLDVAHSAGVGQVGLFEDQTGINELKRLRDDYFNSHNSERDSLKLQFSQAQNDMLRNMIAHHSHGFSDITQKLSTWDPFSHKATSWFDSEWMFGVGHGFNIVIANPPYIDSEGMVKTGLQDMREVISKTYTMTKGNWDIYIAFFELGFNLLSEKGTLAYITPDKWISKPFGNELRKQTIGNITSIAKAGRKVFQTAKVDSIITFFNKQKQNDLDIYNFEDGKFVIKRKIDKSIIKTPFTYDHLFSEQLDFVLKLESLPSHLSDYGICENACATSDAYKLKPLVKDATSSILDPGHLKIINTGTIGKYYSRWGIDKMTYLGGKYEFPVVDRAEFLKEFTNSYSKKALSPKIILKGLNLLDGCLDLDGVVIPGKTTLIVTSDSEVKLKFMLGLLNSKLAIYFIKERYAGSSYNQGIGFTKDMINDIPLPRISEFEIEKVAQIVDRLIQAKSKDSEYDIDEIQLEIDSILYELYNLSEKETAIIA